MRAIRKYSLPLSAIAILLFLAVALTSVGAGSHFTQSSTPQPSAKTAVAKTMKTYTMYSGLWRTDGSFVSTIRAKNVLVVAPMDVTPVLFMADGTPYPLPSVHLAVSGVATININDALANAPPSVTGHISQYGSAALIHSYSSPGHVSASMAVIDAGRSLSYTFPFGEPMGDPMPQTLEGLWWKHDAGVTGWIALSNVGDAATEAAVQLVGPANTAQPERAIPLSAHSVQAQKLVDTLSQSFPLDTVVQNHCLPTIRAAMKLHENEPAAAVEILRPTVKYDFADADSFNSLYPAYIRGLAYLQMGEGRLAAAEFQKLLDHPGRVEREITGALSHLQLARAQRTMGNQAAARKSYEGFLALWKDADSDIPIYQQAKTEYAKLRTGSNREF